MATIGGTAEPIVLSTRTAHTLIAYNHHLMCVVALVALVLLRFGQHVSLVIRGVFGARHCSAVEFAVYRSIRHALSPRRRPTQSMIEYKPGSSLLLSALPLGPRPRFRGCAYSSQLTPLSCRACCRIFVCCVGRSKTCRCLHRRPYSAGRSFCLSCGHFPPRFCISCEDLILGCGVLRGAQCVLKLDRLRSLPPIACRKPAETSYKYIISNYSMLYFDCSLFNLRASTARVGH